MCQHDDERSREDMTEDIRASVEVYREVRDFLRRRDRRPPVSPAARHAQLAEARALADMVANTARRLEEILHFPRYFRVPHGVVHTTIFCRTLNLRHTTFELVVELCGMPQHQVAKRHRLCGHCATRSEEAQRAKLRGGAATLIQELLNP